MISKCLNISWRWSQVRDLRNPGGTSVSMWTRESRPAEVVKASRWTTRGLRVFPSAEAPIADPSWGQQSGHAPNALSHCNRLTKYPAHELSTGVVGIVCPHYSPGNAPSGNQASSAEKTFPISPQPAGYGDPFPTRNSLAHYTFQASLD